MHTVVETREFINQAKKLLKDTERENLLERLARNPLAGDVVEGTGGFRKLRLAREGGGKSGGYRVIYFFYDKSIPVYLFSIYAKSGQENLTVAQRNAFKAVSIQLKKAAKGEK